MTARVIVVATGKTGPSPTAASMAFTPTGTIAATTVQAAIAEVATDAAAALASQRTVISVAAYGTVGDGVTADTAAVQAAYDALGALGGGVLYFPPGTYRLASTGLLLRCNNIVLRGAGRFASTITGAIATMFQGTTAFSNFVAEDLGIDCTGATVGVSLRGVFIAGAVDIRRCLFKADSATAIYGQGLARYHAEDNMFQSIGRGTGNAVTLTDGCRDVVSHGNRYRWLYSGLTITGTTTTATYTGNISVHDEDIDLGWYGLVARASGSGAGVTYTATVLTDTGAAFSGISADDTLRVMPVKATSVGTGVTYTQGSITDPSATFLSAGISKGMIVRAGTRFAFIEGAYSDTVLRVEEWLSDTDRTPAAIPAAATTYTAYNVYIGRVASSTGTTITVDRFHDLDGTTVTPSAAARYEMCYRHPNYALQLESATHDFDVVDNRVRRGWSDQIAVYGTRGQVSRNRCNDGQDMGITVVGGSDMQIIGNRCRHNGGGGIWTDAIDSLITGNVLTDNVWQNAVNILYLADLIVAGPMTGTMVANNRCKRVSSAQGRYGIALAGTGSDIELRDNICTGHTVAGVRNDSATMTGIRGRFPKGTTFSMAAGATIRGEFTGTGSPEASLVADIGSVYRQEDGVSGTTTWSKVATGTTAIGWRNVPAVEDFGRSLAVPVVTAGKVLDTATYDGFGVATTCRNGDIVYIYRQGATHVGVGDFGVIRLLRFTDGGAVPDTAVTIASEASVDLRNVCVGTTPTGRLIVVYSRLTPLTTWLGMKVTYSDDNGATWSTPSAFVTPTAGVTTFSAHGHVIAIDDNTLMASYYGDNGTNAYSYVVFSTDNGATWGGQVTALAGLVATTFYNETCFAYVGGRTIIGLARTDGTKGGYRQIISTDNGVTWTLQGTVTFDAHANAGTGPAWLSPVTSPDGALLLECSYLDYTNNNLATITGPLNGPTGAVLTSVNGHTAWLASTLELLGFSAQYPSAVRFAGVPWSVIFSCQEQSASDRDIFYANHSTAVFQNKLWTRSTIVPTSGTQTITGALTTTGAISTTGGVTAQNGTTSAVSAGNVGGGRPGILFKTTAPVYLVCGTGSPEGVFSAPVGSIWMRDDGGASTTIYVKSSGSGNTGWVALVPAAVTGALTSTSTVTAMSGTAATEVTIGNITGGRPGMMLKTTSPVFWLIGTGTPEGSLSANIGSYYLRTDGGPGSVLYVKEFGTGNTGWVPAGNSFLALTYTADRPIAAVDNVVIMNGTSLTATLPTAVGIQGRVFTIKNINASAVTVATTSAQTVDGTTPATIAQWVVRRYLSDGANWLTI